MALEAGTCTVSPTGTVTGTGLALPVAQWMVDGIPSRSRADLFRTAEARSRTASSAEALAAAIIYYLLANAVISVPVKTTDAGLQRTPTPNNPDTPTQGPSADKTLTGTLT